MPTRTELEEVRRLAAEYEAKHGGGQAPQAKREDDFGPSVEEVLGRRKKKGARPARQQAILRDKPARAPAAQGQPTRSPAPVPPPGLLNAGPPLPVGVMKPGPAANTAAPWRPLPGDPRYAMMRPAPRPPDRFSAMPPAQPGDRYGASVGPAQPRASYGPLPYQGPQLVPPMPTREQALLDEATAYANAFKGDIGKGLARSPLNVANILVNQTQTLSDLGQLADIGRGQADPRRLAAGEAITGLRESFQPSSPQSLPFQIAEAAGTSLLAKVLPGLAGRSLAGGLGGSGRAGFAGGYVSTIPLFGGSEFVEFQDEAEKLGIPREAVRAAAAVSGAAEAGGELFSDLIELSALQLGKPLSPFAKTWTRQAVKTLFTTSGAEGVGEGVTAGVQAGTRQKAGLPAPPIGAAVGQGAKVGAGVGALIGTAGIAARSVGEAPRVVTAPPAAPASTPATPIMRAPELAAHTQYAFPGGAPTAPPPAAPAPPPTATAPPGRATSPATPSTAPEPPVTPPAPETPPQAPAEAPAPSTPGRFAPGTRHRTPAGDTLQVVAVAPNQVTFRNAAGQQATLPLAQAQQATTPETEAPAAASQAPAAPTVPIPGAPAAPAAPEAPEETPPWELPPPEDEAPELAPATAPDDVPAEAPTAPVVAEAPPVAPETPPEAPAATTSKQPWEMTRAAFGREFWLHGRGFSHPRFGKDTSLGGITKAPLEAMAFARVRTDYPIRAQHPGEIALIRNADIPQDVAEQISAERSYSPVRSMEWKVSGSVPGDTKDPHRYLVQQALAEGKPVPPEVLADYPDLTPQAPETPPATTPVPPEATAPEPPAAFAPGTRVTWKQGDTPKAGVVEGVAPNGVPLVRADDAKRAVKVSAKRLTAAEPADVEQPSAEEQAINQYADAATAKYQEGDREQYVAIGRKVADAIQARDVAVLREWLNGANPMLNRMFSQITGLPARTQTEADAGIRSLNPTGWEAWQQERAAEAEASKAQRQRASQERAVQQALGAKVRHNGRSITMEEWLREAIGEGYTEVRETKRGATPAYSLANPATGKLYHLKNKVLADAARSLLPATPPQAPETPRVAAATAENAPKVAETGEGPAAADTAAAAAEAPAEPPAVGDVIRDAMTGSIGQVMRTGEIAMGRRRKGLPGYMILTAPGKPEEFVAASDARVVVRKGASAEEAATGAAGAEGSTASEVASPKGGGAPKRIVSDEAMARAKENLAKKAAKITSIGPDPSIIPDLATLAAGYIERGVRSFAEFAQAAAKDFAQATQEQLRAAWNAALARAGQPPEPAYTATQQRTLDAYDAGVFTLNSPRLHPAWAEFLRRERPDGPRPAETPASPATPAEEAAAPAEETPEATAQPLKGDRTQATEAAILAAKGQPEPTKTHTTFAAIQETAAKLDAASVLGKVGRGESLTVYEQTRAIQRVDELEARILETEKLAEAALRADNAAEAVRLGKTILDDVAEQTSLLNADYQEGSRAGLELGARRMRLLDHWSAPAVLAKAERVKGEPLSREEVGDYRRLAAELKTENEALRADVTRLQGENAAKEEARLAAENAVEEAKKQAGRRHAAPRLRRSRIEKLDAERDELLARLKVLNQVRINAITGIPDESAVLIVKLASNLIRRNALTIAEVAAQMKQSGLDLSESQVREAVIDATESKPFSPAARQNLAGRRALRREALAGEGRLPTQADADARRQKALAKQIANLERRIQEKDFSRQRRAQAEASAETQRLVADRDRLLKQLNALRPKTLRPAPGPEARRKRLQARVDELTRRIRENDFSQPGRAPLPPDPALASLQKRKDNLQAQYDALNEPNVKVRRQAAAQRAAQQRFAALPPEKQLKSLAGRALRTPEMGLDAIVAEIQKALPTASEVDIYEALRHPLGERNPLTAQVMARRARRLELMAEIDRKHDQITPRSRWENVAREAEGVLSSFNALQQSFDVSAPGRQGYVLGASHRRAALKALQAQMQALGDEQTARNIEAMLTDLGDPSAPNAKAVEYYEAGLRFSRSGGGITSEEGFVSQRAQRLWHVRVSERAYVTYLNVLRAQAFDEMVSYLERGGQAATLVERRAIANYINVATGRGNLHGMEKHLPLLTAFFRAPRFAISRFQLLFTLRGGSGRTKLLIAGDLGQWLATNLLILGLASLAGAEVEKDPRNPDFGQIRIGQTRYDLWAGYRPVAVLAAQVLTRAGVKPDTDKTYYRSHGDSLMRFAQSKLGAVSGAVYARLWTTSKKFPEGRTFGGERLAWIPYKDTPGGLLEYRPGVVLSGVLPMVVADTWEAARAGGWKTAVPVGVASTVGIGANTYDEDAPTGRPRAFGAQTRGTRSYGARTFGGR